MPKSKEITEQEAQERIERILSQYDATDPVRVAIISAYQLGKAARLSEQTRIFQDVS